MRNVDQTNHSLSIPSAEPPTYFAVGTINYILLIPVPGPIPNMYNAEGSIILRVIQSGRVISSGGSNVQQSL